MNRRIVVEFECPQCGAPASLEETSRLFDCRYCSVRSYIVPRRSFQYVIPGRIPPGKPAVYFPYWRFRGVLYVALESLKVHGEVINDVLHAADSDRFPESVGVRAEVLTVRFAGPHATGHVFAPALSHDDAIENYMSLYQAGYHSEYLGTLHLIYAPFFIHDNTLYDGMARSRVDAFWEAEKKIIIDDEWLRALPPERALPQDVKFLPTLCPNCGWDMTCARDSWLLACEKCGSFYSPRWDGWRKLGVCHVPGDGSTAIHLPFWQFRAEVTGTTLHTRGDLAREANLIRRPQGNEAEAPFHFWAPAFRIDSKLFLQLAKRITLGQPDGPMVQERPKAEAYPVNFPPSETAKILKIILADFIRFPEIHFPQLNDILVKPKRYRLVYLPFQSAGSEFIHPQYGVRISSRTLNHFKTRL